MVLRWFKKLGGQNTSTDTSPSQPKATSAATKGGSTAGAPPQESKARDPLAIAAANVLQAEDVGAAEQALSQLTDPKVITYVALQRANLRDQALALPQMRSESALQSMEKQSRERNKSVNRFARNALERIKTARRDSSALRVRADELNDALSKHNDEGQTNIPFAQRQAVVTQLETRYADHAAEYERLVADLAQSEISLEPFPAMIVVVLQPPEEELEPEQAQATEGSDATASATPPPAVDAEHQQQVEQLHQQLLDLQQPLAKDGSAKQASPADFAALMTQLPQLQSQSAQINTVIQATPNSDGLKSALATTNNQLQELERLASACVALDELAASDAKAQALARPQIDLKQPSDEALANFSRYQAEVEAASKTNKQQLRTLGWPGWAQTPASIASPFAKRDAIAAEMEWLREQQQSLSSLLEATLNKLSESLDSGQANQSKGEMGQARRLKLAIGKLDPKLNSRMTTLGSRLTELVDWQTFATSPKRQELVDAITTIAETPLAPEAQASRVKQLRAQWNELGGASKAADRRMADQFNAQAQIAFDHCREHFADLAAQRAANTAQREQICQQLRDYLDNTNLDSGDVKAAEQILRTARDAWRQCYPVERKTAKPMEKTFEGLQQQLHDKIKAVWAKNEQAKQELLTQAQGLAADTNTELNTRINEAKTLQKHWQQVGPMPRGGERKLWLAFREACDALFAERDGAKQQQQADQAASAAALTAQVDAFAELVANTSAANAAPSQLRDAKAAFSDAPSDLPGATYNGIKRRFDGLCKDYEALLVAHKRQAVQQRINDLAAWDAATSSSGADATVPAGADEKLLHGLPPAPDQTPSVEDLHRLVLHMEILAEVPSPPADEALRMQLQVERLQQSMGQKAAVAANSGDASWVELALEWCGQRPKPKTPQVTELSERYFAALQQGLNAKD